MGYLNNSVITVDAILTTKGRELLAANDGSFRITQFALADDEIDYWGVKECPEQFPVGYTFDVFGNSNMTKNGEIQLISHHYNFDGHSTSYSIHNHKFETSSKNATNFVSKIPLPQSEEGNFLIILLYLLNNLCI